MKPFRLITTMIIAAALAACAAVPEPVPEPVADPVPEVVAEPASEPEPVPAEPEPVEEVPEPPPAPPPAELTVTVEPANATVRIGVRELLSGQTLELDAGSYEIVADRDGYFSHSERFRLAEGEHSRLTIVLERIPTAGTLTLQGHHSEATLLLDGEEIGQGSVTIQEQEFGDYTVTSHRMIDAWRREAVSQPIRFQREGQDTFAIDQAREQWLWQDEWTDVRQARAEEQRRYDRLRVADPVALQISLSPSALQDLLALPDAEHWLLDQLRLGDRVHFTSGDRQWVLWRRSQQIEPYFAETVAAMGAEEDYKLPWKAAEDSPRTVRADFTRPHELSFALAEARDMTPLADLPAAGLTGLFEQSLQIHHASQDGTVLLLAHGGAGLRIDDSAIQPDAAGNHRQLIEPGNRQATLAWDSAPERLLIVPDRGPTLAGPEPAELLSGEKRIATVDTSARPDRLLQFTFGPDPQSTLFWDEFSSAGPFGQALDLRQLDLGPHAIDGDYERVWLLIYPTGNGTTQRQISARYRVGAERYQTEGDRFLRRHVREEPDGG